MRLLVVALVALAVPLQAAADPHGLSARVAELETKVEALEALLQNVRLEPGEINRLAGPHLIIEGANLHVRSGSGSTDDGCAAAEDFRCDSLTGLGNLIVGYNERWLNQRNRPGSHNVVVGPYHAYASFGGLVAGRANEVLGVHASVVGGSGNVASVSYAA